MAKSLRYSRIKDYTDAITALELRAAQHLLSGEFEDEERCMREVMELEAELCQLAAADPLIEDVPNAPSSPTASE
jgi:hypothetical protein